MAINGAQSAAERLLGAWASSGLTVRPGCAPALLASFEARTGLVLPSDLRELLELANGIESDAQGFSFWPLQEYETFTEQHTQHAIACPRVAEPDYYYVFCDYLHWSWAYAIRLAESNERDPTNRIVPIGMNQMFTVADSFSEFVDLYLSDSARLYPPE